jgi:hypothetical protein
MDSQTIILMLLTALLGWCSWASLVLIRIQVQLGKSEQTFDHLKEAIDDHEERIRVLESFHAVSRINNYT